MWLFAWITSLWLSLLEVIFADKHLGHKVLFKNTQINRRKDKTNRNYHNEISRESWAKRACCKI